MKTTRTVLCLILLAVAVRLPATVPPSDFEIQTAIERAFVRDPAVPAPRLQVDVQQGVVTLSGAMSDLLAWQRATSIARETLGVRSVIDRTKVLVAPVPDDALSRNAKAALADEPAVEGSSLGAAATNGVVVVTGQVDSWQELRAAERAVKNVKGVRKVINLIRLKYSAERADNDIREDIRQRLRYDLRIRENRVVVLVKDGRVKLTGAVGSDSERRRAIALAHVANVKSVNGAALKVDQELPTHSYNKRLDGTDVSDAGIADALRLALDLDPRVRGQIKIRVIDGSVTLTGWVNSAAGKRAAARDALLTHGVKQVRNQLVVRTEQIRNLDRRVHAALQRDVVLADSDIVVTAIGDRIYLNGEVDDFHQKARANRIAADIRGVAEVENRLQVEPSVEAALPPGTSYEGNYFKLNLPEAEIAHELERDIKALFTKHPEIDPEEVHVNARNGVVTLNGAVDSWRIRRLAAEAAKQAGARIVRNGLIVDESYRTK